MDEHHVARCQRWLANFPMAAEAFSRLRPAAQQRFLMQLQFEGDQLAGFSLDELHHVLPEAAMQDLLRQILFSVTPVEQHSTLEQTLAEQSTRPHRHASQTRGSFLFTREAPNDGPEPAGPLDNLIIDGVQASPWDMQTLRQLHKENLLAAFVAACHMEMDCVFTGGDRRPLLFNALAAIEARRMATPARLRMAQCALLRAGCAEQARELSARHPKAGLPILPRLRDARTAHRAPSAWRPIVEAGEQILQRENLDLAARRWWICAAITSSAEAEALALMLHAPQWQPALRHFGGWLTLPLGGEPLDARAPWDLRHPRTPAWPIGDRSDLSLNDWYHPILLVIENGEVLEQAQHWPDAAEALTALLQRHDLP
ncbi:hypothetical protein [Pseudoxanthomonas sp. JBR18]|uniref:hypothetical protein n=1 Tax=Pseudoxanthomonas sp. JBR18 TaxID=2969308 RepID=UPI002306A82F|nr:hypothetical protein [Pseudoxanthomonas sp. JBR18]WCE03450.1 hypothetical protein PJ250_15310 [Pseudoxanthomonas sp. JBR18]